MGDYLGILIFGGAIVFIVTIINPFVIIPVFIMGSYIEPMEYFPQLVQYNPTTILGIIVLLAWLAHQFVFRDFAKVKSKQIPVMWLFILWTICSSLVHRDTSLGLLLNFARMLIIYFLFVYIVKTRKQVSITVWIFLIFGVIAALYGIYQLKANIGIYDRGVKRVTSFFENPNMFGDSLVILIPIALGLLLQKYSGFIKAIILAMLACLIAGVVISYSRGAFIGFITGIFLFVFNFFKGGKKIIAFVCTICLLLVATYLFPDRQKYILWSRLRTIIRAESAEQLDAGRTETTKAGLRMMIDHPLFGVGLGGFTQEYGELASSSSDVKIVSKYAMVPHNTYVQVGASLGVIGLILYVLLLIFVLKDLKDSRKKFLSQNDNFLQGMVIMIQTSILVFLILGFFTANIYTKVFWTIIPLSAILKRLALQPKRELVNKRKLRLNLADSI